VFLDVLILLLGASTMVCLLVLLSLFLLFPFGQSPTGPSTPVCFGPTDADLILLLSVFPDLVGLVRPFLPLYVRGLLSYFLKSVLLLPSKR